MFHSIYAALEASRRPLATPPAKRTKQRRCALEVSPERLDANDFGVGNWARCRDPGSGFRLVLWRTAIRIAELAGSQDQLFFLDL
jgi:hypothetical protein